MGETQKKWIVIVNKSPKGPFTHAEVVELLNQGIIKRNDVAYSVKEGEPGSSDQAGWKMLWQFAEFDRRGETDSKKSDEKKTERPASPEFVERRSESTQDEITEQTSQKVPEEVAEIEPDDLVLRSKKTFSQEELEDADNVQTREVSFSVPTYGSRFRPFRLGFTIVLILSLLGAGGWYLQKRLGKRAKQNQRSVSTEPNQKRVPTKRKVKNRGSTPLQNRSRTRRTYQRRQQQPERSLADEGEIDEEDYDDVVDAEEQWEEEQRKKRRKKREDKRKKRREDREREEEEDLEEEEVDEEEFEDEGEELDGQDREEEFYDDFDRDEGEPEEDFEE